MARQPTLLELEIFKAPVRGLPQILTPEEKVEHRRKQNREKIRRYNSIPENKEKKKESRRQNHNHEKAAAYARQWRANNPTSGRLHAHLKRGATCLEQQYAKIIVNDPCSYCGKSAGELDHINPISKGGDGDWCNLTSACSFCNRSKKDKPLLSFLSFSRR